MSKRGVIKEFGTGIGLLGRGFTTYGTDPGLVILGLVPAIIAGVLLVGLFILLIVFIDDIGSAITWFAHGWSSAGRDSIELLAEISVLGLYVLVAIVTFTSVTLAIGDPFYEKISEKVESRLDAKGEGVNLPPAATLPFWKEFSRGVGESLRMVTISALTGIPLFLCGFIPVVGQTVVPVIGALVGGWFLSVEFAGIPFSRRGIKLAARRRMLRERRWLCVGFGAAVFACFLIPLGAILVTPAAVAGGTILSRKVMAERSEPAPAELP